MLTSIDRVVAQIIITMLGPIISMPRPLLQRPRAFNVESSLLCSTAGLCDCAAVMHVTNSMLVRAEHVDIDDFCAERTVRDVWRLCWRPTSYSKIAHFDGTLDFTVLRVAQAQAGRLRYDGCVLSVTALTV